MSDVSASASRRGSGWGRPRFPFLLGGLLVTGSAYLLGRIESVAYEWRSFAIGFAIATAGYSFAVWSIARGREVVASDRGSVLWVLVVALAARGLLFQFPVSDDVARYLWEGKLQLLGESPYVVSPEAALRVVPGATEDPFCARVNHPELTTIYPPLSELVYRGVAGIAYHPLAWKGTVFAFEVALALVLARMLCRRGDSLARLLIYLWHPTVLVAFAGEAHNDVLLLSTSWLALHFLERVSQSPSRASALAAGAAFAMSILSKWSSAVWWPLFVRRGALWFALGSGIVSALLLLPFLDSAPRLLATLLVFGAEMRHNGSIAAVLRVWAGPELGAVLGTLAIATAWGFVLWRRSAPVVGACMLTATALLVSPTVHPWYATWLVPFLVFVGPRAVGHSLERIPWRPATAGLAYWSLALGLAWSAYAEEAGSGIFRLPLSTRLWIHGPWVLFALAEAARGVLRARRAAVSGPQVPKTNRPDD